MGQSAQTTTYSAATASLETTATEPVSVATTKMDVTLAEFINGDDSYSTFNTQITFNMAKDFATDSKTTVEFLSYIPLVKTEENAAGDEWFAQLYEADIGAWTETNQPVNYKQYITTSTLKFGDYESIVAEMADTGFVAKCVTSYDLITKQTTTTAGTCLSPLTSLKPAQMSKTDNSITFAAGLVRQFSSEDVQTKYATDINTSMEAVIAVAQYYDGSTYYTNQSTVKFSGDNSGASTLALLGASLALVAATF